MNYNAPGVYIEDSTPSVQNNPNAGSTVGIMLGTSRAGAIGVPTMVESFSEFISNFANGLDTPFMANSDLAYAALGFFQNGGTYLYVVRVAGAGASKATVQSTDTNLEFTAVSEGEWANEIKVAVTTSTEDATKFDVTIELGTYDSVTVRAVDASNIIDEINSNIKANKWIVASVVDGETLDLKADALPMSGGTDGAAPTDTEWTNALGYCDFITDARMIAIPGQTTTAVNNGILKYCDDHNLFPIIDAPQASTIQEVKELRKAMDTFGGGMPFPWIKVNDPIGTGLKTLPTAGYVMGVYARIISSRGVQKAPAGIDATLNGVVDLERRLTDEEVGELNDAGVISIVVNPSYGPVIWGARSLSNDSTMRYVSDIMLNLYLKSALKEATMFAVFEVNGETLWASAEAVCQSVLETLRQDGGLKGSAAEAYYVTVDGSNNTDETMAAGYLNIEIGYAPVKPTEFVVIKLSHTMAI